MWPGRPSWEGKSGQQLGSQRAELGPGGGQAPPHHGPPQDKAQKRPALWGRGGVAVLLALRFWHPLLAPGGRQTPGLSQPPSKLMGAEPRHQRAGGVPAYCRFQEILGGIRELANDPPRDFRTGFRVLPSQGPLTVPSRNTDWPRSPYFWAGHESSAATAQPGPLPRLGQVGPSARPWVWEGVCAR